MRRQRWFLGGWFAVLLTVMTACSGSQDWKVSGDPARLEGKVVVNTIDFKIDDYTDPVTGAKMPGLKTAMKPFLKKHPNLQVEFINIPWQDYNTKQQTMLMSGQADVFYLPQFRAFYEQGLIRPIDDLLRQDTTLRLSSRYQRSVLPLIKDRTGKNTLGLPSGAFSRLITVDNQLFRDWGVEPLSTRPTPEEVLAKAKRMTGKNPRTGEQTYGLYWDGVWRTSTLLESLISYYGGRNEVVTGDVSRPHTLNFHFHHPAFVKSVQWMMAATPYVHPGFLVSQGQENLFTDRNQHAIVLENPNMEVPWKQYVGKKDSRLLQRFSLRVNFKGPDGLGSPISTTPWCISAKTRNPAAAWEVVKFLSGPQIQQFKYENEMVPPSVQPFDFQRKDDPYVPVYVQNAKTNTTTPWLMDMPYQKTILVPWVSKVLSQVQQGKRVDLNKEIDQLQQRMEQWAEEQGR
ncbi:extracellular solute-binding protein [Polycladomyces sp. WAk]|uniref:Extracellular solute-binding protein n=1 Tax=Polycladomyces zharkentensis TaxID=2807616 RepID=A0ABS2WKQ9_9BACL|nr:extracellular solute-binding protein [Polycladomyces sp. WAk]MBN2910085.1 extracellular solute-binding protein [Polycladomyces sp. WAk]